MSKQNELCGTLSDVPAQLCSLHFSLKKQKISRTFIHKKTATGFCQRDKKENRHWAFSDAEFFFQSTDNEQDR